MTEVDLTLVLPAPLGRERLVPCRGVVVRSEPIGEGGTGHDVAVFFTSIEAADRVALGEFLAALAATD